MSTATEITRLTGARNTIRDKLIELGLATSTAKMDALATAVDGIENKGAVSASVQEGETYTIPKGYHNGSGTVSGVAGGSNYNLQSKTVTPTKAQQSITADQGFYGLSDVTVKAIPEAYQNVSSVTAAAGDVLANKIIVDATGKSVAGTMPNNGAVSATLDTKTTSYTVPAGYHSGKGIVEIVPEDISVNAYEEVTYATASDGKVIRKVTIQPISPQYKNVTDATVRAGDLLEGVTAYGDDPEGSGYGYKYTGTMPNNGAVSGSIDGLTVTSYTIPKGYHDGTGKVTLTDDIANALAAI